MKKKTRRLKAESIREERELFQWMGPRTFRKKRVKVLKTLEKRVVVRRKIRLEPRGLPSSFKAMTRLLSQDDGQAARSHLAAGNPIYYREPDTPSGLCVKEYPNGKRELVSFDHTGEVFARYIR
jgi:hypothetical protein